MARKSHAEVLRFDDGELYVRDGWEPGVIWQPSYGRTAHGAGAFVVLGPPTGNGGIQVMGPAGDIEWWEARYPVEL
jgi:hypothetical protein